MSVLMLVLVLPLVQSAVMMFVAAPFILMLFTLALRIVYRHRHRLGIITAKRYTGGTTDCSAQNRALLAANLITDCRAGGSTYRTADHRTAIRGECVHADS